MLHFDISNIFKILVLRRRTRGLNEMETSAYLKGQLDLLEAMGKVDSELKDAFDNMTDGIKGELSKLEEGDKAIFEREAMLLGVPAEWYHKTFPYKKKKYTIVALNSRMPKNAVSLVDQKGKGVKGSVNAVRFFMGE